VTARGAEWVKWLVIAAIVLAAWEAVVRTGMVSRIILASPSMIVSAAVTDGPVFLLALKATLIEIVIALALAWGLGIVAGVLAGMSETSARAMAPIFSAAFAVPLIAWYPLFVIWFGIGPASKIVFGIVCGFFPVAMSTLAALHQVEATDVSFARSIGMPRWRIFFTLVLMMAVPSIVAGLRIAAALVVAGIVFAEMLASVGGIGFWISYHRTLFNTGHVYLGILLALLCVSACNYGLGLLEAKLGRWRETPA
jgi:ABC-type nitrate/sulfonate/bicarbonate transport system permease component